MALVAVTCTLIGPVAGSAAAQAPVNNFAPEVVGSPVVGERIVCGAGSWSGSVSEFRYKWLRDAIQIAAGFPYKITPADAGHSLWCVVTAIGGGGSTEAESSNSLLIPGGTAPEPKVLPEVSGKPALGETLSCSTGTWSGTAPISYAYKWLRNGSPIGGATQSTYTVVELDQGRSLACEVTASNAAGSRGQQSWNSVSVPASPPELLTPPQVLGIAPAQVGESLTCLPGTWRGSPPPTFTYQWLREGTNIAGASSATYTVRTEDQLRALSCRVKATNSAGSAEASSSNSILVRGTPPAETEKNLRQIFEPRPSAPRSRAKRARGRGCRRPGTNTCGCATWGPLKRSGSPTRSTTWSRSPTAATRSPAK